MTATAARPTEAGGDSRLARLGLRIGLLGVAIASLSVAGWAAAAVAPRTIEIDVRWSAFHPSAVIVPAGTAVTFVLVNGDPIDHEWIVGDEAVHARHRTGTEPVHGARPTEVTIPAGETRTTTVVFDAPGTLTYVCHLPGHEAYGMVGTVTVTG